MSLPDHGDLLQMSKEGPLHELEVLALFIFGPDLSPASQSLAEPANTCSVRCTLLILQQAMLVYYLFLFVYYLFLLYNG